MGGWSATYPQQSPQFLFNTIEHVELYGTITGALLTTDTFAGLAGNLIQYNLLFYDNEAVPFIVNSIAVVAYTPDPIPFRVPTFGPFFAYTTYNLDSSGNFVGLSISDASKIFASATPTPQAIIGGHKIADSGGVNPIPGNSNDSGTLLAVRNLTIANGASDKWYLPVFNRKVGLRVSTSSACTITISFGPPLAPGDADAIQFEKTSPPNSLYTEFIMNSKQATLTILNTSGASGTFYATLHALDAN